MLIDRVWYVVIKMRFALLLSAFALLRAQGTTPKATPAEYPVHTEIGTVTLAAEYLVHSLPTPKGTLIATDYLVVDVAWFGPSFSRLKMSPDNFTLRINGKGQTLTAEPPGMVAGSIKFPGSRPHLETSGTITNGDGSVTVGPRAPPSRFPGDGNDRTASGHAPTVKEVEEESSIDYRVQNATLPEGEHALPRSGLVYFFYRGKIKNIHSLDLFYEGTMGKATLKLLP
jgi:hypothetical protein